MPRLIDADALADELAVLLERNTKLIDERLANLIEDAVDDAPTVDAVEVVRCKDCIYYGDHGDEEMVCAMMILYPNKPTDYCSLGERREDDVVSRTNGTNP